MTSSQTREMKDTGVEWLGPIPHDWAVEPLRYQVSRVRRPIEDEEIITAFRDGQVTRRSNRRIDGYTEATDYSGYQGIEPGDLVIHAMDAFAGCIGVSDSSGMGSPVLSVCKPHDCANPIFLAYALRLMSKRGWIEALSRSIRERTSEFRWSDASAQFLPIPSRAEQDAIAEFLDRETAQIDALIAKQEELVETLSERRKSLITFYVTGVNSTVTRKETNIPWLKYVPADWSVNKLKRNTYIKARVGWKGLTSEEFETTSYAYLVTGQDFKSRKVQFDKCYQINEERYRDDPFIQLREGDLLVTKDGSIGKVAVVGNLDKPACLNSGIFVVRPISEYISEFLYWVLNSDVFKEFINLTSSGSTILHLYQNVFQEFSFAFPSVERQRQIVEKLEFETSRLDQLADKAEAMISTLRERRNALISAAVTGKIDVRGK